MSSASPRGLRDREVAGVGAGAAHDVAGELGAGRCHVELDEPVVERPELLFAQAAEDEVLPVGDPDLDVEVALQPCQSAELLARDVAEPAVRVRADRAVRATADDVGELPLRVRVETGELDRDPTVGGDGGADAGRRVAPAGDGLGDAAGVRRRRDEEACAP